MTAITQAPTLTPDVGYETMWYKRLDYSLFAQDALFDAWKTAAELV